MCVNTNYWRRFLLIGSQYLLIFLDPSQKFTSAPSTWLDLGLEEDCLRVLYWITHVSTTGCRCHNREILIALGRLQLAQVSDINNFINFKWTFLAAMVKAEIAKGWNGMGCDGMWWEGTEWYHTILYHDGHLSRTSAMSDTCRNSVLRFIAQESRLESGILLNAFDLLPVWWGFGQISKLFVFSGRRKISF